MPEPIRATLLIDPSALPAAPSPELSALLARVQQQLDRIEARQADNGRVLIDRAEAARRLSVSDRTLFDWIKAGEIPVVKIGSVTRFRAATIDEWAKQREQTTTGASA